MRVLHVIDSLAGGGAETSLAESAQALRDLGVELHVAYFLDKTDVEARLRQAGVTIHPLLNRSGRMSRALAVRDLIRRLKPDLVHTTLFEADIAGRIGAALTRTPIVSSIVNEMYNSEGGGGWRVLKLRLAQATDIATARFVRKFHAISHEVSRSMRRRLLLRESSIVVIYRGRDQARLGEWSAARRSAVRLRLGLSDDDLIVLGVAREEHQKGLDCLLTAAALLRNDNSNLRVLIAGREGRESAALDAIVREHGLESTVLRLGRRDDVADLMVAADVLAFPSRWEGLGGTILEAMALECPIVCSDLPVLREVIGDDRLAQFVPVDDVAALAEALHGAFERGRQHGLLAVAKARFEAHFSIEHVALETLTFYRSALGTQL